MFLVTAAALAFGAVLAPDAATLPTQSPDCSAMGSGTGAVLIPAAPTELPCFMVAMRGGLVLGVFTGCTSIAGSSSCCAGTAAAAGKPCSGVLSCVALSGCGLSGQPGPRPHC